MDISVFFEALAAQGIEANARGILNADINDVDDAFLNEDVEGTPRLVILNGTTLDIAQLKADYQTLLAAKAVADSDAAQRASESQQIKADSAIKTFINASPTQIENYINNNVTDLASAKDAIIKLAKALSAIGREEFTD